MVVPRRPIIGIPCMHIQDERGNQIDAMRPTYLRAIEAAGGVPALIHLTSDEQVVRALYERCDGILLPGGDDVDPSYYEEEPHPQLGDVDIQRDIVEIWLAQWARADARPLLGICRGIQVINVAFGGSLYQDILSQVPGALNHRESASRQQRDFLAHSLTLAADSWLAQTLGTTELLVNTLHHQAIKGLAPGLRIVGRSPDGIIEAVESSGNQCIVAVQCHPEVLWDGADCRWSHFFTRFIAVCQSEM